MKNDTYNRYTLTAALPYANGPLHIGHIAGAYLPADIYARYLRLLGKDVAFISGSDEYGAAIMMRAKKEGITPKEIIDKYHERNKLAFERFGISFDMYHRTSEPIHAETAQGFFRTLYEKNEFEEIVSDQFYDQEAQQFLADRFIVGTCPKCANENAYGDQCEKCGSTLSPTDLINPKSTLSGSSPILKKTKHWYLPMKKAEPWLKKWILEEKKDSWKTNVYGQCRSWLETGLQSRSMTRDLEWGIPVPLEEAKGKVLYVWLDAPIGYISATKEWAKQKGKNWEDYWKKDDTRLIHFIGKDNIVFHCIIFPIILKAHGEFILPDNVPANEFLNLEGDKISTSRNWAVWLDEYMDDFNGKVDEMRYVLLSISPETGDSEFTWKDYQARVNNELVAIFGNFVNRVMVLMHKYFEGEVQQIVSSILLDNSKDKIDFTDQNLHETTGRAYDLLAENLDNFKFKNALFEIMNLARTANKYLTDNEPWKTFATDRNKTIDVLNNSLLLSAHLAALLQPFLPETAKKLFKMLSLKEEYRWDEEITFKAGHRLQKAELLFQKVEDEVIQAQIDKLQGSKKKTVLVEPIKADVSFEEFGKMDIRIATVLEAEKVPKTTKLLKLKLDTGADIRTVVSGIAEYYKPEQMIGKQVCLLANLAPREIKGIRSQGMILFASNPYGSLVLVSPQDLVQNGGIVK
jgi:methionyl-tRNA synthetase